MQGPGTPNHLFLCPAFARILSYACRNSLWYLPTAQIAHGVPIGALSIQMPYASNETFISLELRAVSRAILSEEVLGKTESICAVLWSKYLQ